MPDKNHERKLDKELKDTFPASDPTSGNTFVGAPDESDFEREACGCGHSHGTSKGTASRK